MPTGSVPKKSISRRGFLSLTGMSLAGIALRPWGSLLTPRFTGIPEFPAADLLGRVTKGMAEIKARPDVAAPTVGALYEDGVVPWLRERVADSPSYSFNNQRWVETPDGFIYGPLLQPVRNLPNAPVAALNDSSLGPGMWVEVTVPYVDVVMENTPSSDSWVEARVEEGLPVRFYYGQVFWIDRIKTSEQGQVLYRVNPNYYGGVDMLWASAEAFRPIQAEELAPINPEVENKRVVVNVTDQSMSCLENEREVYFCRVSTGAKFDMYGNVVDKWSTPVGSHWITRKYYSLQMSGGTTGAGYDLPGIGWSTIFATGGVAVHSTFWHNNYGDAMSHGCVNVTPEDAKWLFRWTLPNVPYDPGMVDITVTREASTPVQVIES